MYFDRNGSLVSFHVNCYATGFPTLKWNNKGQFNQFIPLTSVPITDTIVNRELVKQNLIALNGTTVNLNNNTVILFWSDFMLKQSKELIRIARKNLALDKIG